MVFIEHAGNHALLALIKHYNHHNTMTRKQAFALYREFYESDQECDDMLDSMEEKETSEKEDDLCLELADERASNFYD